MVSKIKSSESSKKRKSLNKSECNVDTETYVTEAKLSESLNCLRAVQDSFQKEKSQDRKQLFTDETNFVFIHLLLKQIPLNYSTYIHHVQLPHHWRNELNYETCLFVKDVNKTPLADRDADLEQTKNHYLDLLKNKDADDLIKDIMPMRQLRNEFRPSPLRKKLSSEYNAFLCDKKLLRNKFTFLNRFLGKQFWIDNKKVPYMVDLDDDNLKQQIEQKLNQTSIYVSGKGPSISVCIGSLVQNNENLVANAKATLKKLKEVFGENVRELSVKTEKSMSIIFYMDLGSIDKVELTLPPVDDSFVEEEFDFLSNSNVRVYRDGSVHIVKRPNENDDDSSDIGQEDPEENQLIKSINRDDEQDWPRRKVFTPSEQKHKKFKAFFKRK